MISLKITLIKTSKLNYPFNDYFHPAYMKYLFIFLIVNAHLTSQSQRVSKLHFKSVLADTHNDVLSSSMLDGVDISHRVNVGHSDLDRWKEGGLDLQFFSVWTDA